MKDEDRQADEILERFAKSKGVSLRKLGILNRRRLQTVHRREIPISLLQEQQKDRLED